VNTLFRSDLSRLKTSTVNVPMRKRMMCLNESCMDPYQEIMQSFHRRMQDVHLNRYFSPTTQELQASLTDYAAFGLTPDNILYGNGADDILYHIFLAVRESEQSFALSLAPSYFDYRTFALAVGLKVKFLDLSADFSFDTYEYIQKASDPNCRLAILCNPNNPTGNLFSQEQLRQIITALPDKLVLIDETYFEFSGCTFADEIAHYPNLILVRSFSKAFSAAGLRFGYAISSEANINELKKVFTTFHQSILSSAFALSILENKQLFLDQVQGVLTLKGELNQRMKEIPRLSVYPSATNFLTFSIGEQSALLFEYLKDHEIALRDVGAHPRLKNCLRVTISCEEDVGAFKYHLHEFMTSLSLRESHSKAPN
jgi:histidinol-phosphate aminotransferase